MLSKDGKWPTHVSNIIASSLKLLGVIQKLKYTVRWKTLNQISILFFRPILEYASTVWDNCTCYEKDKLEKIKIEAARLVTGTTHSISLQKLYKVLAG